MINISNYEEKIYDKLGLMLYDNEELSLEYFKVENNVKYVCYFTYITEKNKAKMLKEIFIDVDTEAVTYKDVNKSFLLEYKKCSNEKLLKIYEIIDELVTKYKNTNVNDYRFDSSIRDFLDNNQALLREGYEYLLDGYKQVTDFIDLFVK